MSKLEISSSLLKAHPGPSPSLGLPPEAPIPPPHPKPSPSALLEAAKEGHLLIVKSCLGSGVHVDFKGDYLQTAVSLASMNGREDVVNYLISLKCDVNTKAVYDRSPIQYAAEKGHLEVVKSLAAAGADIEHKDKYNGQSAVSLASMNGRENVVNYLISLHCNVNSTDDYKDRSPIQYAAEEGYLEVVKSLVAAGADIEHRGGIYKQSAVGMASMNGREDVVKYLISQNCDVNTKDSIGKTPIQWAAHRGHWSVMISLLAAGADIASLIFENGKEDIVSYLISVNCDEEIIVDFLVTAEKTIQLEHRSDSSMIDHVDALRKASASNLNINSKFIDKMITSGLDLNYLYADKMTILMHNAEKGNEREVSKLLQAGAKWSRIRNDNYKNASDLARANGYGEVVKLFQMFKYKINGTDPQFISVAMSAAKRGDPVICEMLLNSGMDPDVKDEEGRTGLQYAAENGRFSTVSLYIQKGANTSSISNLGLSALQFALQSAEDNEENLGGNNNYQLIIEKILNSKLKNTEDYDDAMRRVKDIVLYLDHKSFSKEIFGEADQILYDQEPILISTFAAKQYDSLERVCPPLPSPPSPPPVMSADKLPPSGSEQSPTSPPLLHGHPRSSQSPVPPPPPPQSRGSFLYEKSSSFHPDLGTPLLSPGTLLSTSPSLSKKKSILETIIENGSEKNKKKVLDVLVLADEKKYGTLEPEKTEYRVVESLRGLFTHPHIGYCVHYVKSLFPISPVTSLLLTCLLFINHIVIGWSSYIVDVTTDISFTYSLFHPKSNLTDINTLPPEIFMAGVVAAFHVGLSFCMSIIFFIIMDWGQFSRGSFYRIPLPVITKLRAFYLEFSRLMLYRQRRGETREDKIKGWTEKIQQHTDYVNFSLMLEASYESGESQKSFIISYYISSFNQFKILFQLFSLFFKAFMLFQAY